MEKKAYKQKIIREVFEYWVNFVYLAAFFSAFTLYRMLILKEHQITSFHFGMALFEALILAKVILIGNALHLGKKFDESPLIIPTFYKAIVFGLFVVIFAILEHTLHGILHGKGVTEGFYELMSKGWDELLSRFLIMVTAFIPFFAFQELGLVLGEGKVRALFFKKRPKI